MTRILTFLLFLTLLSPDGDRGAMLGRDFSGRIVTERAPEGANGIEKAAWTVRNQLTDKDVYRPANFMFLRPAIRELGFFPAIFATFDRITRDNRLGAAHAPTNAEHPYVEEGPEVYCPKRHDGSGTESKAHTDK